MVLNFQLCVVVMLVWFLGLSVRMSLFLGLALGTDKPRKHANMIKQSRKFNHIKGWGCGYGHNLRDCPNLLTKARSKAHHSNQNTLKQLNNTTVFLTLLSTPNEQKFARCRQDKGWRDLLFF
jgi:hypothetical protein